MNDARNNATSDREDLAPLHLFEYDHQPGSYCLMLTDDAMVATQEIFTALGYDGCGYGWAGVARSVLHHRAPELAGRMGFDPEAGMFVAYGDDPEALRLLGVHLRRALTDREALRELIESGEPDWFD
ncbi:immunity 51 family protein [Streptomyces sp. NPDC000594]|uniref:immunity 51 family protein n=1 Tax=Streptomyces sp. NPDC000594 TaxID=3154261 RepID=UPI0033221BFE